MRIAKKPFVNSLTSEAPARLNIKGLSLLSNEIARRPSGSEKSENINNRLDSTIKNAHSVLSKGLSKLNQTVRDREPSGSRLPDQNSETVPSNN